MMPDGVISKTLIHLMERPPGRTSRHIERIIGAQKQLRLQDLLILATDTESLHPDIDTDIVLLFFCVEIKLWASRAIDATRFPNCVCSMAWRFHAINATLSPWPRRLDRV